MKRETIEKIVDRLAVRFARVVRSQSYDVDDLKSVGWLAASQALEKNPSASEGTIRIAVWRDFCDVVRRERLRKTVPLDESNVLDKRKQTTKKGNKMIDETNLATLAEFDEFAEFGDPSELPCDKIFNKKTTRKRKSTAKKTSKKNGSKRLILNKLRSAAIDRESYSADPALNWSTLKKFVADPRAFQLYPDERSDAKYFGTLFHAAFLEPNRFAEKARTFDPPINPKTGEPFGTATKAYSDAFDVWKETIPPDAMICSRRDRETINESLVSFASVNPFVKGLFDGEYATEFPLKTVDKVSGIEIKGRLDYFSDGLGIIDVKTTNSPIVSWDGSDAFYWTARRFGYLYELAYYAKIVEQISGVLPPASMLVFEVVKPYRVGVYKIKPTTIRESIRRIDEEFIPFWLSRPTSKSIQFEY